MKRAITFFLVLVMLLALVACGNSSDPFSKLKSNPDESQVERLFGKDYTSYGYEYMFNDYEFLGYKGILKITYDSETSKLDTAVWEYNGGRNITDEVIEYLDKQVGEHTLYDDASVWSWKDKNGYLYMLFNYSPGKYDIDIYFSPPKN